MQKWSKKLILPSLLAMSLITPALADSDVKFSDLKPGSPAAPAVQAFVRDGIIVGYQGKLSPDRAVTRVEFAKMLALAAKLDIETPEESTFSDNAKGQWGFPYIEAISSYFTAFNEEDGTQTFKPNLPVTREDAAVALVNILGLLDQGEVEIAPAVQKDIEDTQKKLDEEAKKAAEDAAKKKAQVKTEAKPDVKTEAKVETKVEAKQEDTLSAEAVFTKKTIQVDPTQVKQIKDLAQVTDGYQDYVAAAVQSGMFGLDPKGQFNPQAHLTREQAIQLIYQFVYTAYHAK